jgi:hypothetical protein
MITSIHATIYVENKISNNFLGASPV